jgi:hypothetical protein
MVVAKAVVVKALCGGVLWQRWWLVVGVLCLALWEFSICGLSAPFMHFGPK